MSHKASSTWKTQCASPGSGPSDLSTRWTGVTGYHSAAFGTASGWVAKHFIRSDSPPPNNVAWCFLVVSFTTNRVPQEHSFCGGNVQQLTSVLIPQFLKFYEGYIYNWSGSTLRNLVFVKLRTFANPSKRSAPVFLHFQPRRRQIPTNPSKETIPDKKTLNNWFICKKITRTRQSICSFVRCYNST